MPNSNSVSLFTESKDSSDLILENFGKNPNKINYKKSTTDIYSLIKDITLKKTNLKSTEKNEYIDYINTIQEAIKNHEFIKILAAQKKAESKPLEFDFLNNFENLKNSFSETLTYLIYLNNEIWMGATPELIGNWKDGIFETIALAGTAKSSIDLTSKEEEEQEIVLKQIESILNEYCVQCVETKKKIIPYGNLVHFQNILSIPLDNYDQFVEIVHRIHPSAALVGFPKEESINFVLSHEPIIRELYCGVISLKINDLHAMSYGLIRTLKITENQLIWYSGAGITSKSNPEMEYLETQNKIDAVKRGMLFN